MDEGGHLQRIAELEAEVEALRHNSGLWNSMASSFPGVVCLVDRERRFKWVSRLHPELTRERVMSSRVEDFVRAEDREGVVQVIASVFGSGEPLSYTMALDIRPGKLEWMVSTVMPVQGDDSVVLIASIDATDRKNLEQRLGNAQRLESVGRLAAGVAHDFNNLLTVISGTCELISEDTQSHPEEFGDIQSACDKARQLTSQLLAFAQQQPLVLEPVNLTNLVESSLLMLKRNLPQEVRLRIETCPDPIWVKGDRVQTRQLILNLAVNACEAMPTGGELRIGLEARGAQAVLKVRDTGIGMTKEQLEHAFDPFYSSKGPTGTGLGLSMAYGVITQSGGKITVQSEPEQGTTFVITLPRCEAPGRPSSSSISPRWRGGNESILVVEDTDGVRRLVVRILKMAGYSVYEADCGESAMKLKEQGLKVDLLLTDVVMPGLSGPQLATEFEQETDTRVLFMTGYSDDKTIHGLKSGSLKLLQKPFSASELTERVRTILDRS